MPYNGSGTYIPPAADFPAVTQTVISSTKFNNTINDIAAALTNAVTRDGQSPMTAALPMGGWPINAVALGSSAAPSINFTGLATTGLYAGAGLLGMTLAGVSKIIITPTGVGINTSPAYEFTVGGLSTIVNVDIKNNGTFGVPGNATFLRFSDNFGTKSTIGSPGDGTSQFQFYTSLLFTTFYANNAERLRIDDVGRVGINTTSPTNRLHVVGSGDIVQFANASVSLYGYSDTNGLGWFTGVNGTGTGTYYNNTSSYQAFLTGSQERMRLTATGLGISAGNNPTQVLNLYRAGSTAVYMAAGNSNTGLDGTWFGVDTAGNAVINQRSALAMIFSTSGTERMRIDSSGNVGIGTSSPGVKLNVVGGDNSSFVKFTAATNLLRFYPYYNFGGNNRGTLIEAANAAETAYADISISGSTIQFLQGVSTERMRISATGNLTVNAPSSGTTLTLSAIATGISMTATDGTRVFSLAHSGGAIQFGSSSNHDVNITSNNTTRIVVSSAGNLTINAPSSGTTLALNSVNTTTPYINYVTGGTTTVGAAGAASALPANPVGYVTIAVAGTSYKMPYYNT